MTEREERWHAYAMVALCGMIANGGPFDEEEKGAAWAYDQADAMLKIADTRECPPEEDHDGPF